MAIVIRRLAGKFPEDQLPGHSWIPRSIPVRDLCAVAPAVHSPGHRHGPSGGQPSSLGCMRKNSPAGRRAPHPSQSGAPRPARRAVQVGSPAAVLAVVPHLLGFVPRKSLIVIGAGPPRGRIHVTLRFDLPDPPDPAAAKDIAEHAVSVLTSQRQALAVVIGYGPGQLVTPIADIMRDKARRAGLDLRDVLRVEDGRYWSYLCREPSCCPPEGVPVDAKHPAAAAMTAAGAAVLPDRAALAATISPLGGLTRQSMRDATRRAEAHATDLLTQASRSGRPGDARRLVVMGGLSAVAEALATYRRGGRFATDDQVAWLSLALSSLRVRDDAWARMDAAHRDAHRRLWTDVVRRAEREYVPAPASLLAFCAWQQGNGALANVALDRALDADPAYSMALLLRDLIDAGAPPAMARLPMTPEEVAASYAAAEDDETADDELAGEESAGQEPADEPGCDEPDGDGASEAPC
jgi:hypothetical protein